MGHRFEDNRGPPWVRFASKWRNRPGVGRWYKHNLSKARRSWERMYCRLGEEAYRHQGGWVGWESWCNWKGW